MATLNVPSPRSRRDDAASIPAAVNTLENGDRLSRAEFERRYEARSDIKKAELIEGVVYMPSPTRSGSHAQPHAATITWMGSYAAATPGVHINDNPTVRLDLDNEPQPDVALLIDPNAGGQARVSEDDYIEGAPELVAEIAASSASYDLHDKLHAYRRNGGTRVPGLADAGAPHPLVSSSPTASIARGNPTRAAPFTAASFRGCVWRSTPCCEAIWRRYCASCSMDWPRLPTRHS